MQEQSETARELIALLERHREGIATSWVKAIRRQMSGSPYGQRPPDEIYANNLIALDMLKDLFLGLAPSPVWLDKDGLPPSMDYVNLGVDLGEVVTAALLLEDVFRPVIEHSDAIDSAAAQRARTELRRCVHLLAQDIVQGYAGLTSQHLREQQKRTALVLEMTRTVSRTLDLDEVLHHVAQGIASAVGVRHCLLYLVGDHGGAGALWGATDELPRATAQRWRDLMEQPIPLPGTSLARLVLERQEPLTCYDAQADPRVNREFARALGVRSLLEVPCVRRGRVLAIAIAATMDQCRAFTAEQVELAWGIANAVAPAIENARLYQQVEQLAVVEERARLAREIHDDLAQTLGALQLKASLLDDMLAQHRVGQARASLVELQDMISEAYTGVREAVFNLRARVSPGVGILSTLDEYLSDYRLHYDMDVVLQADAEAAAALTGNTGVQVICIIQEALTNARKHARASQAWVRIERQEGGVRISVEDNGRGFDPLGAFPQDRPHFGLQVMRERAEKVSGSLSLDSRLGQGTRIVLQVPCQPRAGWT